MISSVREELRAIFALFSFSFLLTFILDFLPGVCNSFGNTASSVAAVFLKKSLCSAELHNKDICLKDRSLIINASSLNC